MSGALNCKLEMRHDLLQKVQVSEMRTGDEHDTEGGTLFAKSFHAGL